MNSNTLSFSKHVDYLVPKLIPNIKILGCTRQYSSQGLSIYLYKSLIEPIFNFDDFIYEKRRDAERLYVLQKNCLRICLKAHNLEAGENLYRNSETHPLPEQQMVNTCCFVHKGVEGE